ncbi:hypothetical protein [Brevibacterium litoralis]|uniref:hypothetical protein n=1 Tax=Brevibacterium litoralis TaxID=3138935 RepID=UPI0032EE5427
MASDRPEGRNRSYGVRFWFEEFDSYPEVLGHRFVPFSDDTSQVLFAFDYRAGFPPAVVAIDRDYDPDDRPDKVVVPVARSFEDFLRMLHE